MIKIWVSLAKAFHCSGAKFCAKQEKRNEKQTASDSSIKVSDMEEKLSQMIGREQCDFRFCLVWKQQQQQQLFKCNTKKMRFIKRSVVKMLI